MKRAIIAISTAAAFVLVAPLTRAAAGWYLLIPLVGDYDERAEFLSSYKILDAQPLSKWAQQSAYDSAAECEAVKDSLIRVEQNFYSKQSASYIAAVGEKGKDAALLKHMRRTAERSNANINALTASRCIKSDDPRLGK